MVGGAASERYAWNRRGTDHLFDERLPGLLPLVEAHDDGGGLRESQFRERLCRERRAVAAWTLDVEWLRHLWGGG